MIWKGEYLFGTAGAAFRGSAADNAPHSHATVQIVASGVGPATIEVPGAAAQVGSHLLIRPGVVHALLPIEGVTLVFLEPQTAVARDILQSAPCGDVIDLPAHLRDRLQSDIPLADVLAAFERSSSAVTDERVLSALDYLAGTNGPRAVTRAAAAVGLSPARLRALTHAHLDTPLTAWLAWRRLERAGKALARGASLAEAAVDAGFADQAHLSRATRQVFGITPRTAGGVVHPQAKRSRPD